MSQSKRFAITATAAALASTLALSVTTTSQAATFRLNAVPVDPVVETVRTKLTGKQRLHRLLRRHRLAGNPITQSVRDATGDPNITVLDYRNPSRADVFTCTFFNLRKNQRVLKCE